MTDTVPAPKYPDVTVKLLGEDGNAFAIMGAVRQALRRAGHFKAVGAYVKDAMASGSYDGRAFDPYHLDVSNKKVGPLIQVTMKYVNVT